MGRPPVARPGTPIRQRPTCPTKAHGTCIDHAYTATSSRAPVIDEVVDRSRPAGRHRLMGRAGSAASQTRQMLYQLPDAWEVAMLINQVTPNLSVHIPNTSPQGAGSSGIVIVPAAESPSQNRRSSDSSSPLRETE
jgi:hypothetical protein